MFQFRGFPPHGYVFTMQWYGIAVPGFPIRISAGHRVLTARRRISLFAASFIASLCPGILRTPFLPWPCDWFSLVRLSISVLSIFCLQTRCTRPSYLCLISRSHLHLIFCVQKVFKTFHLMIISDFQRSLMSARALKTEHYTSVSLERRWSIPTFP